jgi:hypothetical protein
MKHIALTILIVTLGVAGVNAQQHKPVKMRFSGTNVATTINLQTGTVTDETQLAGNGNLGHSPSVNCTLTDLLPSLQPVASAQISRLWPERAYFVSRMEVC